MGFRFYFQFLSLLLWLEKSHLSIAKRLEDRNKLLRINMLRMNVMNSYSCESDLKNKCGRMDSGESGDASESVNFA